MITKKILLAILCFVLFPVVASAGLPLLNATCPGGIEVHADEGGPVYINGKEARLKKLSASYYEAKGSGVTISISINPDGSQTVSYTGKHGANGICQVSGVDPVNAAGTSEPSSEKVAVKDMARYCAGEASAKFHQHPRNISTQPAFKDQGMYSVFGQFPPSGADPTIFICTFTADGIFVGIDKQ